MIESPPFVERARRGDADALSQLLRESEPDLRRFAARVCRSNADAEDAVAHAMTTVAFRLDRFNGLSRLSTWLFSVIRNECARYERLARRWVFGALDALTDRSPTPEQALDRDQLLERVVQAVQALRPELREVFVARELEQLSVEACAERLRISEANVKVRLYRARTELRDALGGVTGG